METAINKASEIIRSRTAFGEYNNQFCVLAQENLDGRLTASAITPAKADGIEWLTFCTGLGSNKSKRVERDSRACVCFCSDTYSISLKGRLEIVTDEAVKRDNWYSGLENHYTGPDDPDYCVLRFHTERYSLLIDWEETGGTI